QRVDQSASSSGSSTSGNALTRKAGPLPVWAWILIGSVAAYVIYKKFAGNTTGTTTAVSNRYREELLMHRGVQTALLVLVLVLILLVVGLHLAIVLSLLLSGLLILVTFIRN
ncbi:MAG: hypothetical protein JWM85_3596, partial [Acidimicrobiaceae bacterium]|nr:hypothetical protein [Acidimicrobiaceae bacterium]